MSSKIWGQSLGYTWQSQDLLLIQHSKIILGRALESIWNARNWTNIDSMHGKCPTYLLSISPNTLLSNISRKHEFKNLVMEEQWYPLTLSTLYPWFFMPFVIGGDSLFLCAIFTGICHVLLQTYFIFLVMKYFLCSRASCPAVNEIGQTCIVILNFMSYVFVSLWSISEKPNAVQWHILLFVNFTFY